MTSSQIAVPLSSPWSCGAGATGTLGNVALMAGRSDRYHRLYWRAANSFSAGPGQGGAHSLRGSLPITMRTSMLRPTR
jgi:hypothetical protein